MRSLQAAFLALVLGFFAADTVLASIVYLGQSRRVSASSFVTDVEFDSDQNTEVAPDTGPFHATLFVEATIPSGDATAFGEMWSELTTTSIHTTGSARGTAEATGNAVAYASASSNLALSFQLNTGSPYVLQGWVEGGDHATATVQISQPFNTVAWFSGAPGHVPVYQTGTLAPGDYTINITCGGGAVDDPETLQVGEASYDLLFLLGNGTDSPVTVSGAPALTAAPNPFRGSTRLTVPSGVDRLQVVDARGRVVRSLVPAGTVTFDGFSDAGRPLASGVYWVRAFGDAGVETTKLVRIR